MDFRACGWNNLAHFAAFCYNKERKVVLRKGSLNPYECSTAQRTHPDPAEQRRCSFKRQHAGGRAGGVAADRGRRCGTAARRRGADRCHPPGLSAAPGGKGLYRHSGLCAPHAGGDAPGTVHCGGSGRHGGGCGGGKQPLRRDSRHAEPVQPVRRGQLYPSGSRCA